MVATAAAVVLALTAACQAVYDVASVRLVLRLSVAVVLGLLAGYAAARAVADVYYEAAVFRAFAAFLVTTLAACRIADRAGAPSPRAGGDARPDRRP